MKNSALCGLLAFVALLAGCAVEADPETSSDELKANEPREVMAKLTLPLVEVSGLAARSGRYVAVGDRTADIVSFSLDAKGAAANVKVHHTDAPTGKAGSQWEAVALDGAGNAVVLSETGQLFVLGNDLERVTATVKIDYKSVNPLVDGHVNDNSLGEGLVLLDDGHILVAVEKSPSLIVEMGPAGSPAGGYTPGREVRGRFTPGAKTFVALAAWEIKKDGGAAPDLSDLTVGPGGALYALSQQGKAFVRLEETLRPDERSARVKDIFPVGKDLTFAEGLVFQDRRPIVGRDRDHEAKNLYVLSPIPPR